MEGVALAAFTADEERARGLLQQLLANLDPAEGKLVLDHCPVVAVGLAETLEGGRFVLGLGEGGAAPGLYLQAHPLGLGLFFFQHPGDVLAGFVAGFFDFYEAGVALFFGAFYLHEQPVYAALAGELPLPLIGGEFLCDALAGGEVLLVLVRELETMKILNDEKP